MSECLDKFLGQMLHNYELGLLSDDDRENFEIHMFECDFCRSQVGELLDSTRILRHDPDAEDTIQHLVQEGDTGDAGNRKITRVFPKVLVVAAVVLMLAVPLYWYLLVDEANEVTQTISFYPARSDNGATVEIDKGGLVQLKFHLGEAFHGAADLAVFKVRGDTVLTVEEYSDFDNSGTGSVVIPVTSLDAGYYSLVIEPCGEQAITGRFQYFFVAQ